MPQQSLFIVIYQKLSNLYNHIKTWVAYGGLILLALVIYADEFLGPARDFLLPASAITVMAIMFETLFSLSEHVVSFLQAEEYDSIIAALPRIMEVMDDNRKDSHKISMIIITGGTTFNAIFPYLYRSTKK